MIALACRGNDSTEVTMSTTCSVVAMTAHGPARHLVRCSIMSGVEGQSGLEIDRLIRSRLTRYRS